MNFEKIPIQTEFLRNIRLFLSDIICYLTTGHLLSLFSVKKILLDIILFLTLPINIVTYKQDKFNSYGKFILIFLTFFKKKLQIKNTISKKKASPKRCFIYGAGGGGRTRTLLPGLDFESSTSANSITPAYCTLVLYHKIQQKSIGESISFHFF